MRYSIPVLIVVFCLFSACGEKRPQTSNNIFNNDNNTNNTNNSNNTNNTNSSNNMTNNTNNVIPDPECEGVVCIDPDQKCVRGMCISDFFRVACEVPEELGVLPTNTPFTTSGNTENYADSLRTTCADLSSNFSGPENAFEFTVDQPAQVQINLSSSSAIDWVMEIRTDVCYDPEAVLICRDPEQINFLANPDTTYYLIVEPLRGIDEGEFDLDFEFTQTVCAPVGGTECAGTQVAKCLAGGTNQEMFQCADGCTDGVCHGDTCNSAITVTAGMSFSGDVEGYNGTLDFEEQPTCSASGVQGLQTPGQELILSLPGLTTGQVVTVDAQTNDSNDNAIFVTNTCTDQEACVAAVDLGDMLNWTVPANGDYFIIIDKTSANVRPFEYSIDIQ